MICFLLVKFDRRVDDPQVICSPGRWEGSCGILPLVDSAIRLDIRVSSDGKHGLPIFSGFIHTSVPPGAQRDGQMAEPYHVQYTSLIFAKRKTIYKFNARNIYTSSEREEVLRFLTNNSLPIFLSGHNLAWQSGMRSSILRSTSESSVQSELVSCQVFNTINFI